MPGGAIEEFLNVLTGISGQTVVAQLLPVSYQISVLYLGDNRIRRTPQAANPATAPTPAFRCRFQLQRGTGADGTESPVTPMQLIENAAVGEQMLLFPNAQNAAKKFEDGGDNSDLSTEARFKIMITDNHGVRSADLGPIVLTPGNTVGKLDYYSQRGWMADVNPAVPFRIVVRKIVGFKLVDMDAQFQVAVQVKDPAERFDQTDSPRRDYLEAFFKKFNKSTGNDTKGDDNAPTVFQGQRTHPGTNSGADLSVVLKTMPLSANPTVDSGTTAEQVTDFSALTDPSTLTPTTAKLPLTLVTEPNANVKVGVTDMAFTPPAVGGDNYRFLFWLLDNADKDVRDLTKNGFPVNLLDGLLLAIPKPFNYCTPQFFIWRRIEFRLCVLVNQTVEADLNWDAIRDMYRKAYCEVIKPTSGNVASGGQFFEMTATAWRDTLKQVLGNLAQLNNPAVIQPANYAAAFFPASLQAHPSVIDTPPGNTLNRIIRFIRLAITSACNQSSIPDPLLAANQPQGDTNGFYMVLLNNTTPNVTTFGAYLGDRVFWAQKPPLSDPDKRATNTSAHELGHAVHLRHAVQGAGQIAFVDLAGTNTNIIIGTTNRGQAPTPLDHDGNEFFTCLLSSVRPLNAEPCGNCALLLRALARGSISQTGQFREEILGRYGPVSMARLDVPTGTPPTLTEITGQTLTLSSTTTPKQNARVLAVGPAVEFRPRDTPDTRRIGRVNLSGLSAATGPPNPWSVAPAGIVSIAVQQAGVLDLLRVTAVAPGSAVITFAPTAGLTQTLQVTVT